MSISRIQSLRIKAKLLQKSKRRAGTMFRLKDAFSMIARASGFSSWQDMKLTLDANEVLCPAGSSAHWKVWYANYDEAVAHLGLNGGFLLPYQKDFFVCDADYIRFLGIESEDPDLVAVGPNWAEPKDPRAFDRLLKRINRR